MRACEVVTLWNHLPRSCSAVDRPIYIYKQGNDAHKLVNRVTMYGSCESILSWAPQAAGAGCVIT